MPISNELKTELEEGDYNGYSNQEIFNIIKSKTVPAVGSIRGADLRNVVSILAAGLQHRLDNASESKTRTSLLTGFKYMTIPDYAFNLSSPVVDSLIKDAVTEGLVTQDEYDMFIMLATYQKPVFPEVTLRDIIEYKNPELISDAWEEIPPTDHRNFYIRIRQELPEAVNIVIEASDLYSDRTESAWYHCTTIRDVFLPREYVVPLSYNGYARKIRWKSVYYIPLEDTGTR